MAETWKGPVYLKEPEHIYIHKETNQHFTSVTKVIHSLVNPFDEDAVAEAISKQSLSRRKEKYHNMNKAQIIEYWNMLNDEANEYGTHIHELIEEYLLKDGLFFPTNEFDKKVIEAYEEMDIDLGETVWPERIMFSPEHELAGTADLVMDINEKFFDIGDFKTNRVFDFYDAFGFKTLRKPLEHLQDCHYSIYTIQLSIYAYMYELETGRKCRRLYVLYWDRETEKFNYIPMNYLRSEAKKVLDMHKYNMQFM